MKMGRHTTVGGRILLIFLANFTLITSGSRSKVVYYVVPTNNSLPPPCVSSPTCHTLDQYIADGTLNKSDSTFKFLSGTHLLSESLVVYNSSNLTLQANESAKVDVVCISMWSIAVSFNEVNYLTIHNIGIVNCSYKYSNSDNVLKYVISALHVNGGANLRLYNLTILNGGFSVNNTQDQVEVAQMNVTSNLYHNTGDPHHPTQSFGGSLINYVSCNHHHLNITVTKSTFEFFNEHSINQTTSKDTYHSHGLGLRLSNCSDLHVTLKSTLFHGCRSIGKGGNVMIVFLKSYQSLKNIPVPNRE